MWQYIKGFLLGLLLLWLMFFLCFAISGGIAQAAILSITLVKALIGYLQLATHGTGLWIVLFIIISSWIWSFGTRHKPQALRHQTGPVPNNTIPTHENLATRDTIRDAELNNLDKE